jgi:uncharacterized protein
MTVLRPQSGPVPRVRPDELSAPFWEGCRSGRLLYQSCGACGAPVFDPARLCRRCGSNDLNWAESAGRGVVYSFSTVFRPQDTAFTVPYAAALVELAEGYHLVTNVVNCGVEVVHVGMAVRVLFHRIDDELVLPYFEPVSEPDGSAGAATS